MLALIPDPSLVPSIEPYLAHDNEEVQTSAAATIFRILERVGDAR
jgi:HEAT repeat protein